MRVLVCGGRDFNDWAKLEDALDSFHRWRAMTCLIHGAARGADTLAEGWARLNGVPVAAFPADWKAQGKGAGSIRNEKMLREGKPNMVVAFPGGAGTADMVNRAGAAGLFVWLIR